MYKIVKEYTHMAMLIIYSSYFWKVNGIKYKSTTSNSLIILLL